jgi:hypothetical protein
MEKYIAILKTYKDKLQFLHWNTAKEYANHILFERLMGDIDPLLDRFVEVYMGSRGITQVDYAKFKGVELPDTEIKEYLSMAKREFTLLALSVKDTEANVVIDILEMFDRHLYLL